MHTRTVAFAAIAALSLLAVADARPVAADPIAIDEGGGIKRATWDFSTSTDYLATNVTLAAGSATLASTRNWWNATSDADFAAARESATKVVASSGLRLLRNETSLLADGAFDDPLGPWGYSNGTAGLVSAGRDPTARARLSHETLSTQFDSMDDALGVSPWTPDFGGTWWSALSEETGIRAEGTGSMRDDLAIGSGGSGNWAGAYRDDPGTWNWSRYNRLAARIEGTASSGLGAYLYLDSLGGSQFPSWIAPSFSPGWDRYVFDISPFSGNNAQIDRVTIGFFGPAGVHTVYLDDVVLFNHTAFDESASVSQTFTKPGPTGGAPDSLELRFDVEATPSSNLVAYLRVAVGGTSWSESPIPAGSRGKSIDLSGDPTLQATGPFSLTFSLQLIRLGTEEASMAVWIDNVTLTARSYESGSFVARSIDGGSSAIWTLPELRTEDPPGTSVVVETRTGNSPFPGDPSWNAWQIATVPTVPSPPNRFLQWRLSLNTVDGNETPVVTRVSVRSERFAVDGTVRTASFLPPEPLSAWRSFHASDTRPAGTAILYDLSVDGGSTWVPVADGQDLSGLATGPATVRATLSTGDTSRSPAVTSITLRYQYMGSLAWITVQPATISATAGTEVAFSATAFDIWGHPLPSFGCLWATDDPWGRVSGNGSLTGTYRAGRAGGPWRVSCADSGGVISGFALVTVIPGPLSLVTISPSSTEIPVDQIRPFAATGRDGAGNPIALSGTVWTTTIGTVVAANETAATLRAPPTAGNGTVTASVGGVSGNASVLVTDAGTPRINGTVPDLVGDEDTGPWTWELTPHAEGQPDSADTLANLRWFVSGADPDLLTVMGQGMFGAHRLVVLPRKDAFGVDEIRLMLEDRDGKRTSQDLSVTVRPVDDPPSFTSWPGTLYVRHGEPYRFDWLPYVRDIDTPTSGLGLTTDDPTHVATEGLNATYAFPSTFAGATVFVRHRVSDGASTDEVPIEVRVTDNPPPQVTKPLPDLFLDEDTVLRDAFAPESLRMFFHDPEGDQLFFSLNYTNLMVDIWDDSGWVRVNVTGEANFCGVDRITFRAMDPEGAFAEHTVRVTTRCVNDSPDLAWTSDVHVRFDERYPLDLTSYISDVDNEPEELVLTTSDPVGVSVQGFVMFLEYTRARLGSAPSYTVPLDILLADPTAATERGINVIVSDNRPPELLQPLNGIQVDEDTTGRFDLGTRFWDYEDGGALAYAGDAGPIAIAFNGTEFTLTPSPNWYGQALVAIRATDAQGAFAFGYLIVDVLPVNDAPRLTALPPQTRIGGGTWVFDLRPYASDVDDAVSNLTFTVSGSSHARTFGFLLVLDYPDQDAVEQLTVTVEDAGGLVARTALSVRVIGPSPWSLLLSPWTAVVLVACALGGYLAWRRVPRRVYPEDVFLIGRDGRLLIHVHGRLRPHVDEDLFAGMLTAITLFVREAFRESQEELDRFEIGRRTAAVERGAEVYLVAIYPGQLPIDVRRSMKELLADLEEQYGGRLASWSFVEELSGLREFMAPFVGRGRYRRLVRRRARRRAGAPLRATRP